MQCQTCARKITSRESRLRGYGPICFKAYLATLSPEEREVEQMFGYNWCPAPRAVEGWYLVVTPEHASYLCNPLTGHCECPASWNGRDRESLYLCKHVRLVRRDTGWEPGEVQPATTRPNLGPERIAEIERDIATDFA